MLITSPATGFNVLSDRCIHSTYPIHKISLYWIRKKILLTLLKPLCDPCQIEVITWVYITALLFLPTVVRWPFIICEHNSNLWSRLKEKYRSHNFFKSTRLSNSCLGAKSVKFSEYNLYDPVLEHSVSFLLPAHMSLITVKNSNASYLWMHNLGCTLCQFTDKHLHCVLWPRSDESITLCGRTAGYRRVWSLQLFWAPVQHTQSFECN